MNAQVKWSEFTSGPPLLESLASNRVDLSFLGDGALIAGLDKKLPFEVIAQTGTGESNVPGFWYKKMGILRGLKI